MDSLNLGSVPISPSLKVDMLIMIIATMPRLTFFAIGIPGSEMEIDVSMLVSIQN